MCKSSPTYPRLSTTRVLQSTVWMRGAQTAFNTVLLLALLDTTALLVGLSNHHQSVAAMAPGDKGISRLTWSGSSLGRAVLLVCRNACLDILGSRGSCSIQDQALGDNPIW